MALVGIIMGSQSDWPCLKQAAYMLETLGIPHEVKIASAHRTPDRVHRYVTTAADRGRKVIIAGAGGAAHLAGVAAALTTLPVLGVPMESKALKGLDSPAFGVRLAHFEIDYPVGIVHYKCMTE